MIDFQSVYAAITASRRGEDGRYPERDENDLLPFVEFTRQRMIRAAVDADLGVVATNSDGNATRRDYLLGLLGAGAVERVLDPGRDVVAARLANAAGLLSPSCSAAMGRWYGNL